MDTVEQRQTEVSPMHSTTTNDTLTKRLAREYRTKGEGMTRANELLLIAALFARRAQLPVRPVNSHTRSRANTGNTTIRQYEARQHPIRTNGAQVSDNTNKNRYVLLDPDAACDDIPEKTTTHGWTVVTHKRKPQKEITPTSRRRNTRTEVEARVGVPTRRDARQVEAHVDNPTCGDARLEVEAHVASSTRGDACPPPIPSPDPGVTPLTRRLDAQSDVSGVARTQSPRVAQLRRRIREATNVELTPPEPSHPDIPPDEQQARPETAEAEAPVGEPTGGDAHPSSSTRDTDIAPREGNEELDDKETLDDNNVVDPMRKAERYRQTLGPLTDEERYYAISQYLMEGRWTYEDEKDTPTEPTSTEVDIECCKRTAESEPLRQGDVDVQLLEFSRTR
ncbi:hypothetical protein EDB89DRAFT_1902984 [Lactarius sanguifluus]|nr:hypothetical protein EDB89DRAFT_1902984 [Lactarius sanguifluus]